MKKWMIPLILGLFVMMVFAVALSQTPDTTKKVEPVKSAAPVPKSETLSGGLKVEKIACGTSVVERELQGQDSTFAENTEKVYCWSLITGGSEGMSVNFVWYRNGKEVVRVPINVKYPRARVYAYKSMYTGWNGDWKVDVVDTNDQVLGSTSFKIQ